MQDGNYLIRESRNALNAYTLSLCSRQQIMNYRIIRHPETGEYAFEGPSDGENPDERSSFKTMLELIGHYEQTPVCMCMFVDLHTYVCALMYYHLEG